MKLKRCKACKELFIPTRSLQVVCGPKCAHTLVLIHKARIDASDTRKRREALKTRQQWLSEAQSAFNAYIRQRDSALPCISCGRHVTGDYHAGHYRSVGAAPQLRFDENNVHKQCGFNCNVSKSGNAVEYRIALVKKIGVEKVEALESNNQIVKWTIEDAKRIKAEYKQKLKQLKESNESS